MERESFTDTFDQIKLLIEVDGTNLQFHAAETLFKFLFHTLQHLLIAAHPHQSIDGNTYLTTGKGGVE